MKRYISKQAFQAYPQSEQGIDGYRLIFEGGNREWMKKETFEDNFTESVLTDHQAELAALYWANFNRIGTTTGDK